MGVKLITVGMLKEYLEGRDSLILEDKAGQPVAELLAALDIPSQLVAIALVNGHQVPKNYVLRDGDVLKLAPFIGGGCYGRREEKTDYDNGNSTKV